MRIIVALGATIIRIFIPARWLQSNDFTSPSEFHFGRPWGGIGLPPKGNEKRPAKRQHDHIPERKRDQTGHCKDPGEGKRGNERTDNAHDAVDAQNCGNRFIQRNRPGEIEGHGKQRRDTENTIAPHFDRPN